MATLAVLALLVMMIDVSGALDRPLKSPTTVASLTTAVNRASPG